MEVLFYSSISQEKKQIKEHSSNLEARGIGLCDILRPCPSELHLVRRGPHTAPLTYLRRVLGWLLPRAQHPSFKEYTLNDKGIHTMI